MDCNRGVWSNGSSRLRGKGREHISVSGLAWDWKVVLRDRMDRFAIAEGVGLRHEGLAFAFVKGWGHQATRSREASRVRDGLGS